MNGYKKIKGQYTNEWVNILINQVYELVDFFNDHVYDWGRLQKIGPHTRTTNTSQLPPEMLPPFYGTS